MHRNRDHHQGKDSVVVGLKRGQAMDLCASLDERYVCCGVHVLRAVSNCPFHCSYCFLQTYLTDTTTSVVGDAGSLLAEVKKNISAEPWRFFRIGTWELGDSLALGAQRETTRTLVRAFAEFPNAMLELKTKSCCVDHLLDLEHRGRTVIAWSLNTDRVIEEEEGGTASLEERLKALAKVARAGYRVGLHFDPMIAYDGCDAEYASVVRRVFEVIPVSQVVWISIGSLRFNPEMKRTLEIHYPRSRLTAAEMIMGDDRKCRYLRPVRVGLYQSLYRAIQSQGGDQSFVYLCMERANVWKAVLGYSPEGVGHLAYLITESLYRRFPGLVPVLPARV